MFAPDTKAVLEALDEAKAKFCDHVGLRGEFEALRFGRVLWRHMLADRDACNALLDLDRHRGDAGDRFMGIPVIRDQAARDMDDMALRVTVRFVEDAVLALGCKLEVYRRPFVTSYDHKINSAT